MQVYTDGSDIDGTVGAAAWYPHKKWSPMVNIGPSSKFTVYEAELVGIWLALNLALRKGSSAKKLTIYTDNQAAILSTVRPRMQSGQLILARIIKLVDILHNRGVSIMLRWIPAHVGVLGNEIVDRLAKRSTGWLPKANDTFEHYQGLDREGQELVWLPQLQSSCKRTLNDKVS